MQRFERLLGSLPPDCILDGEIVALDKAGRPKFKGLIFNRDRRSTSPSTSSWRRARNSSSTRLEGIVAKRLGDPYVAGTQWCKILNRSYSQKEGRSELFERG